MNSCDDLRPCPAADRVRDLWKHHGVLWRLGSYGENVVSDGERRELQDAINRIQRLSDEHWYVLDPSCNLMEDKAWLGPAGSRLNDSTHDDRRELRTQLARAVESARDKLSSLPGT